MKLSGELRVLKSLWETGRGLMFRKNPLHFFFWFKLGWHARHRITMWFVFFPIDVVIIDDTGKIIEIKEGLQPWSYYRPKHAFREFVEFPSGFCKRCALKVGKQLVLDEKNGTVQLC